MFSQIKKSQANLLNFTGTEDHKNDAAYMKEVDSLSLAATPTLENTVVNESFSLS